MYLVQMKIFISSKITTAVMFFNTFVPYLLIVPRIDTNLEKVTRPSVSAIGLMVGNNEFREL